MAQDSSPPEKAAAARSSRPDARVGAISRWEDATARRLSPEIDSAPLKVPAPAPKPSAEMLASRQVTKVAPADREQLQAEEKQPHRGHQQDEQAQ